MRHLRHLSRSNGVLLLLLLCLAATAPGCGDDDDGAPSPTGPATTDFDEIMATGQAAYAAPLAVAMLENVAVFAQGVAGKDLDYSFSYDEDDQHWIATMTYDQDGYTYAYTYTVQYRDAMGQPQQEAQGAASMRYTQDGTSLFNFSGDGYVLVMSYDFDSDVTASGLGTGALLVDGGGGYDLDYDVTSDGRREQLAFSASWQTLGDGVSYPTDGCPTGTMRYSFAPYRMDIVFDGTSTAAYTLHDGAGSQVPEASGTVELYCGK